MTYNYSQVCEADKAVFCGGNKTQIGQTRDGPPAQSAATAVATCRLYVRNTRGMTIKAGADDTRGGKLNARHQRELMGAARQERLTKGGEGQRRTLPTRTMIVR